jgi:hypothetical protein
MQMIMQSTKLIYLFFFLLLPIIVTGQTHRHEAVVYVQSKRFKVGDMYYASSIKGLQFFMNDLQDENPGLHQTLLPDFRAMLRNRNVANATWIASGVVGTTIMVGAFTFWQANVTLFKPGDPFHDPSVKLPGLTALTAAFGVYLTGGLIGLAIFPKDADIYNFINLHNRNNPNQKMNWEIGMDFFMNMEPGFKLTMNF